MSSKQITGSVVEIAAKPWERGEGDSITLYSFKLDTDNRWFRCGTTDPGLKEGQEISFVTKSGVNVDMDSFSDSFGGTIETPEPAASKKETKVTRVKKGGREGYWENKDHYDKTVRQNLIGYQSARTNATEIVCTALKCEALSLGKKSNANKLDLLTGFVEEVTKELFAKYKAFEEELDHD